MPRAGAAIALDAGEQSEVGYVESHTIVVDASDFSPHQFIAPDETRGDNEQDGARSMLPGPDLSAEVLDSEDAPSPDGFMQKRVRRSMCSMYTPKLDDGEQYE